jgi:hypothetical protein
MFQLPPPAAPIDQGDIFDGCPLLSLAGFIPDLPDSLEVNHAFQRVIVLTQTCDLANQKSTLVTAAVMLEAAALVEQGLLKAADVKGPVRSGRVYGWYFLPRSVALGLPETIIDLRQLHTVRRDVLTTLCLRGQRRARLKAPYREHLAKHFADTFSRIGLPAPYETDRHGNNDFRIVSRKRHWKTFMRAS